MLTVLWLVGRENGDCYGRPRPREERDEDEKETKREREIRRLYTCLASIDDLNHLTPNPHSIVGKPSTACLKG